MATFNVTGLQSVIKDLERLGDGAKEVGERMLRAGADVVAWEWQKAIKSAGHIDTGSMLLNTKPDKSIKTSGGVMEITVYPRGSDATGTRNAEKAFIAHYGRTRQRGSGFVDLAVSNAQAPAWSAMESIWDQFIAQ